MRERARTRMRMKMTNRMSSAWSSPRLAFEQTLRKSRVSQSESDRTSPVDVTRCRDSLVSFLVGSRLPLSSSPPSPPLRVEALPASAIAACASQPSRTCMRCVCVCVRICVYVCVHAHVHVTCCARARVCAHILYMMCVCTYACMHTPAPRRSQSRQAAQSPDHPRPAASP